MTTDGILRIDLHAKGEVQYRFAPCNRLFLPKNFVVGRTDVGANPTDAVIAVRLNDSNQPHPWAIQDGYLTSASGVIDHIFVTVITPGEGDALYLCTGTDIALGYGNADGLSPVVGSNGGGSSAEWRH